MGFFDSIGDTWHLIRNSMNLISNNKDILKPTIRQIFIGLFLYIIILFGLVATFFTTGILQICGILSVFFGIFFLLLIFPFIKFYYRAAQSWIVYKTFTGKKPKLSDGLKRARKNKGDIIGLTIVDMVFNRLSSRLKGSFLTFFVGKIIEEAWDLVGNYLLPASIIPEKNLLQSVEDLPRLKENIPASLVGVFGFDFVGDAVKGYLSILFILSVALSVAIFSIYNSILFAIIVIVIYIGCTFIIGILIDMAKTIYFTTFYVTLTKKNEISVEYMGEVESYLKQQPSKKGKKQSGKRISSETKKEKINKLKPYIKKYRRQKYSDKKIKEFLIKNNWPEKIIDEALKKTQK